MARRGRKIQPAEKVLQFVVPQNQSWIDIGFCLSQLNRKAYRQGMEYVVTNVEMFSTDSTEDTVLIVQRIPHTWVAANAWVKGFKHWKSQQYENLRDAGNLSTEGAYNDFKVYPQQNLIEEPLQPANIMTLAAAQAIAPTATMEWGFSQVVVPNDDAHAGDTQEYNLHWVGSDGGFGGLECRGLIHAYAQSRSRPHQTDPNIVNVPVPDVDGGLYAEMEDVGDMIDDVIDNARFVNNSPPYLLVDSAHGSTDGQYEFYPGGSLNGDLTVQDILIVRSGSTISTDSTGPFSAWGGIIALDNEADTELMLQVTVAPGPYQGVMARPMQDVN